MRETSRAGEAEAMSRHRDSLFQTLGDRLADTLADHRLTELMSNADGSVWLDRIGKNLVPLGEPLPGAQAESLIATVAGHVGKVVNQDRPILEAELSLDGSRLTALLPPVVSGPVLTIRTRARTLIPLSQYVEEESITVRHAPVLFRALRDRKNIVISGGPGSGKTTFANALIHEMEQLAPETERFILIEDTYELRCEAENHVTLHTAEHVTLRDLVKVSLRLRPDRIIVGEVRGAEALDLLKAWNTGNPGGVTTVHANSAEDALHRLDQLAQEAGVPSQALLVASSVDMVVHMERRGSKRLVTELITVKPFKPQTDFIVEAIPAE